MNFWNRPSSCSALAVQLRPNLFNFLQIDSGKSSCTVTAEIATALDVALQTNTKEKVRYVYLPENSWEDAVRRDFLIPSNLTVDAAVAPNVPGVLVALCSVLVCAGNTDNLAL